MGESLGYWLLVTDNWQLAASGRANLQSAIRKLKCWCGWQGRRLRQVSTTICLLGNPRPTSLKRLQPPDATSACVAPV